MKVGIGAVTGDARFFLLTEASRAELEIPEAACVPVVTRARQLCAALMTRDSWSKLKQNGERTWLFRPPPSVILDPAVRQYLEAGIGGSCRTDNAKIARREPWYETPLPPIPHGFMSGMAASGPWITLNATTDVNATNTLYVVNFTAATTPDERAAWSICLLSEHVAEQVRRIRRQYPDGLWKLEPADLRSLLLPMPPSTDGAISEYCGLVETLKKNPEEAHARATEWLKGTDPGGAGVSRYPRRRRQPNDHDCPARL